MSIDKQRVKWIAVYRPEEKNQNHKQNNDTTKYSVDL